MERIRSHEPPEDVEDESGDVFSVLAVGESNFEFSLSEDEGVEADDDDPRSRSQALPDGCDPVAVDLVAGVVALELRSKTSSLSFLLAP